MGMGMGAMLLRSIVKAFKAVIHIFQGKDGQLSIKRIIGTLIVYKLLNIITYAVEHDKIIQPEVLISLVTLITLFFALTMVPNNMAAKIKDTFNKNISQNDSDDSIANP